jgi:hypothetical protein
MLYGKIWTPNLNRCRAGRVMRKIALILLGILIVGVLGIISPFLYDGFHSAAQRRALQHRSDFLQIAAACATLAHAITNESSLVPPADPRVPALLRSLSPRHISASSNHVTLEFHGGFDHYGYRFRHADTDPKEWSLFFYTEHGEKFLTTISHD